jgi:Prokaryotic Cytochrome C oxidase subunit IV
VLILLIAFVKVRFVGLYFMELREAPMLLRGLFETYCIGVCALVISMFVFA